MLTGTTDVDTPDGPMPVYEAKADDPKGAIVVIQEVFGVNHHIEDVTRRLAEAGYHAAAPHLFHRTGSPALGYEDFGAVLPHMQVLDDAKVLADVDAAIGHLSAQGWGSPQIGLVGFCFGGRVSFLVATERPLGAVVGFYGGGIVTARFPQFPSLIDRAPDLKAPWLGLFGGQDESIPLADVERIKTEVAQAAVDHDVVVYDDAGHGFHCDARPGHYNDQAAKAGWQRALAWFETHLAPPPAN